MTYEQQLKDKYVVAAAIILQSPIRARLHLGCSASAQLAAAVSAGAAEDSLSARVSGIRMGKMGFLAPSFGFHRCLWIEIRNGDSLPASPFLSVAVFKKEVNK